MPTFKTVFVCAFAGALMACNVAALHAAPLPTNVTAMKSMVAESSIQVQWRGWRGGGWGYRGVGGWGYRGLGWGGPALAGAVIGGAIASNAYGYYGGPYYGGSYYGGYYPGYSYSPRYVIVEEEYYVPAPGYYVPPYGPSYGYPGRPWGYW
jgi:hypothetical protein